jgi:hypothetical protein
VVALGRQAVSQKRVRLFEQRLQQRRFATLAAAAEYNDDDSGNDDNDRRSAYRDDIDNDVINEESEGRFLFLDNRQPFRNSSVGQDSPFGAPASERVY